MALQESARDYEGYMKWKAEHEVLKDKVTVLEKLVDGERKNVLRRNRA